MSAAHPTPAWPGAAGRSRRSWLRSALALGVLAPWGAQAGGWPSRPVRLMVAYPPGGVSDDMARALAQALAPRLGVPVVLDHRAGAGGTLAMEALARAPADGHTLCFSAITPLTLSPQLGPVRYDPARDIDPVCGVMLTPTLVVASPALDARDFAGLLALARARPGQLRWATSGHGTTGHLVLEEVRHGAGVDIAHIPYRGGGAQLTDALAGHFELLSTNAAGPQLRHVQTQRLRALAVGAPQRLAALPEVPTLAELGLPRANRASVFGVFAPGGTPAPIRERLGKAIDEALQLAPIQERLLVASNLPTGGGPQAFAALIEEETFRIRALLRERGGLSSRD